MSVISKLAHSLGRRDEVPNQLLAKEIVKNNDKAAVKELVDHLYHKSKDIQNDCIKVIYEVGADKPELIAGYAHQFIELLSHKNNRLQWGAMTAIYTIVSECPAIIYEALPQIIAASNKGSVITKDNAIKILVKLCGVQAYTENAFLLLNEQLLTNQLAMYAELALPVIDQHNKELFTRTLMLRLGDIEKDSLRKRIEKVIKKVR